MSVTEQVDALQKHADDVKSSFEDARKESSEQIQARIKKAKADAEARQKAADEKASQADEHAKSQWKAMKADVGAKAQALQDRIDRKRDERDVKKAEKNAERG